ncbi:outer membrane protein assembly factor BamE domain-containing protein [Sphingomonas sp. DT-204]|uniref:outer membrane protein assembly factor BamE domain-containing protein n=1 Tax=Sphingomonas sp. DT-204 TaxID=3396166 RepID=UPI003F1CD780
MKLRFLAVPLLVAVGLSPAIAGEKVGTASTYVGRVDPSVFHNTPLEHKKLGVVVDPAAVRMITPGVDKFTIYRLIGTPHFDEGITRRWNYVLFFPTAPGSTERVRCRMEIRFTRQRGLYNVSVSEVIWQDQACADRVAAAD